MHRDQKLDPPLAAVDLLLPLLLRQRLALHRGLTGGEREPGERRADDDVLAAGQSDLPFLGEVVLRDGSDSRVYRLANPVLRSDPLLAPAQVGEDPREGARRRKVPPPTRAPHLPPAEPTGGSQPISGS